MKPAVRILIAALVAVPAVLVGSPASAASVNISGNVNSDGSWTYFNTLRTTNLHGTISLAPTSHPGGFLANVATSNNTIFGTTRYWNSKDYARKNLATDVLSGTTFKIVARRNSGSTSFAGNLIYPRTS